MRSFWLGLIVYVAAGGAQAADQLAFTPRPAWVIPVEQSDTADDDQDSAAFRILLLDQQVQMEGGASSLYSRTRWIAQSPQALPYLGSINLPWNPASQTVTVHGVRIIRNGAVIDALAGREFTVLRREQNLESAVLTGILTGTLQLDDLRVGDVLELETSIDTRNPVLGDHGEFLASANIGIPIERYHLRALWPTSQRLRMRTTDGWEAPTIRRRGAQSEIVIDRQDLQPLLVPETAPMRFHQVRQIELTDYTAWSDIAEVFAPLYEQASVLEANSPLHARIAEIRETSSDPAVRAAAALRLVQDEVRYLALTMGEGGLTPASADETWRRRLGDCKAKTALLLALLKALDVPARAVLVSTGDDALDQRLPVVGIFDHVIVEAQIDGRSYWLDGTSSGDRSLADLTPPAYGWVLPIAKDARLVRIEQVPPSRPRREFTLNFDASAGLFASAPTTGSLLQRGDAAVTMQAQFSVAPTAQRDAYMRQTWQDLIDDLEIDEVRSSYDRERNEFRMTMTGKTRLDWVAGGARRLEIPLSHISWGAGERREPGPYRDLPWTINFPVYSRFTTTIVLPPNETFTLRAEDVSVEAANYLHTRTTRLDDGQVVMQRETRSLGPEMTEAQREAAVEPLERLSRQRAEIQAPRDYLSTDADQAGLDEKKPQTTSELIQRGITLRTSDRTDDAIEAFNTALARDPRNVLALANRGWTHLQNDDYAAAHADFQAAEAIEPNDWLTINGLGATAIREERFQDAATIFSDILVQEETPYALGMRAQAYIALKDYDLALADVRRAQALDPDADQYVIMEIATLVAADRLPEAARIAETQAEQQPDRTDLRQMQAGLAMEVGDYAKAEAALTVILQAEPDHPRALVNRADARAKQGDLDGARQDMAAARELASNSAGLSNTMCWTQAVVGYDLEQALTDCDAALAKSPDEAAYLDSRALVLLQMNKPAEALAVYDKALATEPNQAASRYGRGLALRALGRADEAQTDIDAAIAISDKAAKPFKAYEARHPASIN